MDSIVDIDHILATLSAAFNEDYLRKFCEYHSTLFSNLMNDEIDRSSEILEAIEKYCEIANESDFFNGWPFASIVVRELSLFISKTVHKINEIVLAKNLKTEAFDKITLALKRIKRSLVSLNLLMKKVSCCRLALKEIVDFVLHFGSIIDVIFQHCTNYGTENGEFSSAVKDRINELFVKCNEIHNNYVCFIQSLIVDCDDKEDIARLIAVVNKVFLVGVAVSSLDLKTMALSWKGFMNLLKPYAIHLRTEFDLAPIIKFFCGQITEKLVFLCQKAQIDSKNLALKVSCFLFKIVVKLCEYWYENLNTECIETLLRLIFFLYQHSVACCKYSKVNFALIEEIDVSLISGVDSLISVLIKDSSFIRNYTSKKVRKIVDVENETGSLLLLAMILQKLISCDEDVQCLWFQSSILELCLTMISDFHRTLFYEIEISASFYGSTKSSRAIFLYDALLINISSLIICSFSRESFSVLEITLLKYFLRSSILVKIFISDLWCILDRYGNSELCLKHVKYLLCVVKELDCGKVETTLLLSLVKRLCKFLPPGHRIKLFEMVDFDSALFIDSVLPTLGNRSIANQALSKVNHLKCLPNPRLEDRIRLLKCVMVIQKHQILTNEEFNTWMKNSGLVALWAAIVEILIALRLEDLDQTAEFIFHLSCVTSSYIACLSPDNILQILTIVDKLLLCDSTIIQLNAQKILQGCGLIKVKDLLAEKFHSLLESSFKTCLRSNNPIVRQYSLESFSYFSHVTIHETIIQNTIANDLQLKENLSLYLQKKLRKVDNQKRFEDYIQDYFVIETTKKACSIRGEEEMFSEYKPKKVKLNSLAYNKMQETKQVLEDLFDIVKSRDDPLNEEEKDELRNLLQSFSKLREFL